jgi:hypothetical protein
MRVVWALGLLIALSASAGAAPVHRSRPPARAHQRVIIRPSQPVTAPGALGEIRITLLTYSGISSF